MESYPVLSGCNPKVGKKGCKRRCTDVLSEEQRKEINESYWGTSYNERCAWIANMVDTIMPVRRRKIINNLNERNVTRVYHLVIEGRQKVQTCSKIFLSTLGLTKDTIINTSLKKTSEGQLTPSPDLWGCHVPPNKKPEEVLEHDKSHIMSYNPCITHYRRKHAPNRLYISPEFTIKVMYDVFCDSNKDLAIS